MKCECKHCDGSGEVTIECEECDGEGTWEGTIEEIALVKEMDHYEELVELQKDARRAIRQAARLTELNPARAESYDAQCKAAIAEINRQANELVKD